MAAVFFKKGLLANLPEEYTEGVIYITTDEAGMYVDVNDSTRIRVSDFQVCESTTDLINITDPSENALYYISDQNILVKWNGESFIQINVDTGATEVSVDGDGNTLTGVSYDSTTRTLEFTTGTFATSEELEEVADKVSKALESEVSTIIVNGVEMENDSGIVNITVPTKVSDLENDEGFQTEEEVETTVTEKIAEVVANAPEDFDTLKEIADWIENHADSAAEMNSQIKENTENIDALDEYVGEIPDDSEATTVIEYIQEVAENASMEWGEF